MMSQPLDQALFTTERVKTLPHVKVLGVPFVNTSLDTCLSLLKSWIRDPQPRTVNFVNAHCLNVAQVDRYYMQVLHDSDLLLPDGSGVKMACRMLGQDLEANLNGTDLLPHLCDMLVAENKRLFLLGAAPGVADRMADKLREQWPTLEISGVHHGFIGPEIIDDVLAQINQGTDLLLVAMGVPAQEKWISTYRERLEVPVVMGVGGLFDFYSQRIPRAPGIVRRLGMEWAWRLLMEPRRMFKRYVLGNPSFLMSVRKYGEEAIPGRGLWMKSRSNWRHFRWRVSNWLTPRARRAMDIVGASGVLLVLSPLLLGTVLAIRLESPGPVLFGQERIGRHGKPFKLWKFRSMYIDAEERLRELQAANESEGGVLFKMKQDPRITRVGRIIRKLSIDELPQLWNVLRGEMALVGPRPALAREVALYEARARMRLDATPGLTGLWQVSGRSDLSFEQQIHLDLFYLHRQGIKEDIKLLLRTIPAVLTSRGAY